MRYWILLLILLINTGCNTKQTQKRKGIAHRITSYYSCVEGPGILIDTIPPICEAPDGVIWVGPKQD